jgi:glycosyltransferase involved in cell wall biosynthesis
MNRVLILIKGLGRGGAEQLLASSLPHLDHERFEYEMAYLLPWKDALVPAFHERGVPVHCLDGGRGPAWAGRLNRLVRRRGIELIHEHSPYAAIGSRLAVGDRVPHVYTEHNVWGRYHRATYWGNATTFPINRWVFAVSEHVHRSIRFPSGLRSLSMPTVETLYHGIDHSSAAAWEEHDGVREELGVPADAPMVGAVANLKAHKRLDLLLQATVAIRRRVPNVRVVIVGQGPMERDLRALSARLGLEGTVVFAGFREDAQRIAAAFDVFVMASEHEGLSIALIEAMALGRPVVVTDADGLVEVVRDGVEGFIVPSGRADALADRITQQLGDPALRSRMGAAGRMRAADFDIRTAIRRVESVYEEVLS